MPKLDRTERPPAERREGDLEPAGLRQPRPQGQQRRLVLPGRQVRGRRRQRPLRLQAPAWNARRDLDLYRGHPGKPYAIGEWGLGPGIDHPDFVQQDGQLRVATTGGSRRSSTTAARAVSTFDLSSKPRSARAYRRYITAARLTSRLDLNGLTAGLGERAACAAARRASGHAVRRARDVVEPEPVAERDRCRLAAVLAADAHLQVRLHARARARRRSA